MYKSRRYNLRNMYSQEQFVIYLKNNDYFKKSFAKERDTVLLPKFIKIKG